MFGLGNNKVKSRLQKTLSKCLEPLKDELGNVPLEMQTSESFNASLLGICEGYAESQSIIKKKSVALIVDAVFEEIFRRESTQVLTAVDEWRQQKSKEFIAAYEEAKTKTISTSKNSGQLDVAWFGEYANNNFEPARNLML